MYAFLINFDFSQNFLEFRENLAKHRHKMCTKSSRTLETRSYNLGDFSRIREHELSLIKFVKVTNFYYILGQKSFIKPN